MIRDVKESRVFIRDWDLHTMANWGINKTCLDTYLMYKLNWKRDLYLQKSQISIFTVVNLFTI